MDNSIKQPSETIRARGFFLVQVIRDTPDGPRVIHQEATKNLVVNTGKRQTWRMSSGLASTVWRFGRVGSSSAAAASGNTNLTTPVTGTLRTVDSRTLLSGTRTFQLVWSYPSGAGSKSATIKELVVMNQRTSPGGSALCRAVLAANAVKTTADKLKITYNVRIT